MRRDRVRFVLYTAAVVVLVLVNASFTLSRRMLSNKIYVTVSNLRNDRGFMQIQVYRDQASFEKEEPWRNLYFSKKGKVKDGKMSLVLDDFSQGTYGLALCDDENGNKKMDFTFLLPTEGFGFSDYYHTSWSRPVFSDFKFYLQGDRKTIMKVRYI